MDLAGILWLDIPESKQDERDDLLSEVDERVANHKVTLHCGEETRSTKTDENGKYFFERVYINRNYQISFEYEGQQYKQVEMKGFGVNAPIIAGMAFICPIWGVFIGLLLLVLLFTVLFS